MTPAIMHTTEPTISPENRLGVRSEIEKAYRVSCALCTLDREEPVNSASEMAAVLRGENWRYTVRDGWTCPEHEPDRMPYAARRIKDAP